MRHQRRDQCRPRWPKRVEVFACSIAPSCGRDLVWAACDSGVSPCGGHVTAKSEAREKAIFRDVRGRGAEGPHAFAEGEALRHRDAAGARRDQPRCGSWMSMWGQARHGQSCVADVLCCGSRKTWGQSSDGCALPTWRRASLGRQAREKSACCHDAAVDEERGEGCHPHACNQSPRCRSIVRQATARRASCCPPRCAELLRRKAQSSRIGSSGKG